MSRKGRKHLSEVDFIKSEVMQTGFPLEMEVFSHLNSRKWLASLHEYYFDFDLNITREIDVRAVPFPLKTASNFTVFPNLAIECKKSEMNAWVFFKTKTKLGRFGCAGQYVDLLKSQNIKNFFDSTFFLLSHLPHYTRSRLLCMAYTQVKLRKSQKKGKPVNEIFEAVNQVIKYISYVIEDYLNAYKKGGMQTKSCVFFLPVIVFDGKLYRANFTKAGISLKRAKHALLVTFYKPRYEVGRCPFFVDIVTRKYFPTYVSMIEKEIGNLNKKLEKIKDVNDVFLKRLGYQES